MLFTLDVGQAFLRGLTFEQLRAMPGGKARAVQFRVPPGAVALLQQLPGYEDFNPLQECLDMLRPAFGLKDAPRAWSKACTEALKEIHFIATVADPQIFVRFEDQRGMKKLVGILSAHVDDLKGGCRQDVRLELEAHLERSLES